jgi:3-carboxy-cis,cis-muconate cycloisomerase
LRKTMTDPLAPSGLYGPLFASAAMRAIVADRARLQRMLDVEAALARAEATVGVIPLSAVGPIAAACHAENFDFAALGQAAVPAGNIAIPLVKALTAAVAAADEDAARFVHWGATSQDIIDSALALELGAALDALDSDLDRAIAGFAALAERHRATPVAGRTWLQHALPIPFGLKLAGYGAALARSRKRLARLKEQALVLQFGGAAGTLAALGPAGVAVAQKLAAELGLPLPEAPWHAHRDRLAEVAATLAILAGTCGKIARDVTLLMQTDVAEAHEPAAAGRGGSSTMPQKRNPVAATIALAAATMAPNLCATILAAQVGEHERATGAWQAEWPTFPALLLVVSGALRAIVEIGEGLEVDAERMGANLDATGGQIMAEAVMIALGAKFGRLEAHHLVEGACRMASAQKRHLKSVLQEDARIMGELSPDEIARLFDPLAYQGAAQAFIDRLLATTVTAPTKEEKRPCP